MSDNKPDNTTEPLGKNMMTIAWIIAIGLATWIFGGIEDRQNNPNQSPLSSKNNQQIIVELTQNRYGHYVVNGTVNGKAVTFILDTGATDVAIPGELENYLQLERGYAVDVYTANGTAKAYLSKINYIEIGDIKLDHVRASINPSMEGKEILLGMAALKQLEFRQKGKRLTLIQTL